MLEYLKIINKNFEHKGYFSSLISRHQSLKNKSRQKKESFVKLGLTGIATIAVAAVISLFIFHNINSFFVVLGCSCVLMCSILLMVKEFISEKELKYKNEIESEFFSDLKNNHELINDLSLLVIDDDTEENFNEIVDNVVQDNDSDTFSSFHRLLYNYYCLQSKENTIHDRNNFLKGLKIDVRKNLEEDDTPESFQEKARERVLEML